MTQATLQRKCACSAAAAPCARCADSRSTLQRKGAGALVPGALPGVVGRVLATPGRPLEARTRELMQSRFGYDFSSVRVHSDREAHASADAVHARAYTAGRHVVLGPEAPPPSTPAGLHLLAHELAHVVQQSRGGPPPGIDGDPALEHDADRVAADVVAGRAARVGGASGAGIARDAKPAGEVVYEVDFPEGNKRLTAAEFEEHKARALRALQSDLKRVADLSDNGRQSQTDMLKEYHGGVESLTDALKKPKALIGIASDIWGDTTPPYIGMWSHAKTQVAIGLQAVDRGDLRAAAYALRTADQQYRDAMAEWNAYRAKTIGGAEHLASNLETVRDVSFAIALTAGAVLAAPVVAGIAVTAGATGTGLTLATAGGTALVTGAGGTVLGGGSTALASAANDGKVDWAGTRRDATKFGKQGVVTGLTAGLGRALGAAGKAAELGKPLAQAAVRRCVTEAGINVTGEITSELLDRLAPTESEADKAAAASKALIPPKARAMLIGCVGGALGVSTGHLRSGTAKVADKAIGAGVSFADAKLQGRSNEEALLAATQSTVTSHLIGHGQQHTDAAAAKKAAAVRPADAAPVAEAVPATATARAKPAPRPDKPKASIRSEDAKASKETANGHRAVVTPEGVGVCSPSPCPVIHVEYKAELDASPELKQWNERVQAMRTANPEAAAVQAAALVNTLQAQRNNAARAGSMPRDNTLDAAVDAAFAPNTTRKGGRSYLDADAATDSTRKRVPGEPKPKVDIEDLVPTAEERQREHPQRAAAARVRTVQGRRISDHPELEALWNSASAEVQAARGPLSGSNYKEHYNEARNKFWDSVRADAKARAIFENAGFDFEDSPAPLLRVKDPSKVPVEERRVSLDHNIEKKIDWRLALDPGNLTFEMQTPNATREIKQARHPELRPGHTPAPD